MPFPDSPRVIYEINPLVEVICQVRFPAILRIDSELPASFQDRVRDSYPIFAEGSGQQQIKLNLQPPLADLLGGGGPISLRGRTSYEFISADRFWKVVLTRESLALACSKYRRWEEFKHQFQIAFSPLLDLYSPQFFTRVGLRYQDVIQRNALGLESVEWKELLQPHIAGELSSPDVASHVTQSVKQTTVTLEGNQGRVLINHSLAVSSEGEQCYLIDSDFSTDERTESTDVLNRLDDYNHCARRLFRWCITDRLHDAMHPEFLSE